MSASDAASRRRNSLLDLPFRAVRRRDEAMDRLTARGLGIASAIAATGLGLVYLALAGAPLAYLAIQAAALATGLVALLILSRLGGRFPEQARGPLLVLLGSALLATALLGPDVDGAARWIPFGAIY